MLPNRSPATIESIKEGCVRIITEIASLKSEVRGLTAKLQHFKKGREIPESRSKYDWGLDRSRGEAAETPEPKSPIHDLEKELSDQQLVIANRLLIALGKELDGAVREVRAAKATLQAIADDSDLRAEFKGWQSDNR